MQCPDELNLKLVETAAREPSRGEILIKVAAVSLNYRDGLLIDTGFGMPENMGEPLVPASDLAGTVVATGEDVSRFAAGDRVISTFIPDWIEGAGPGTARTPNGRTLGGPLQGVLAEYVTMSEDLGNSCSCKTKSGRGEYTAMRRTDCLDSAGGARKYQSR